MIEFVMSKTFPAVAILTVAVVAVLFVIAAVIDANMEEEEDKILIAKCRSCARRYNCDGFGCDYSCKRYMRDNKNEK